MTTCPASDVVLEDGGQWAPTSAVWSALMAWHGVLEWRGWTCQLTTCQSLSEGVTWELGLDGAVGENVPETRWGRAWCAAVGRAL